MERKDVETNLIPLVKRQPSSTAAAGTRTATTLQTLGNIIVSIVGTGILGLPFAFRIAGWLAGALGVAIAGVATFYCMLLLVSSLSLASCFFFLFGYLGKKGNATLNFDS